MCRIGGRLRSGRASDCGAAVEIPPLPYLETNHEEWDGARWVV
jgi:hypothetical protein